MYMVRMLSTVTSEAGQSGVPISAQVLWASLRHFRWVTNLKINYDVSSFLTGWYTLMQYFFNNYL